MGPFFASSGPWFAWIHSSEDGAFSRFSLYKQKEVKKKGGDLQLTGQVRKSFKLLFPELGDTDGLTLLSEPSSFHPCFVGVGHELLQILWVQCVKHVKKVVPWWPFIFWVLGREEGEEMSVLFHLRPQVSHGQLVILRDLDRLNIGLLHELLLPDKHLFQEVLGDHRFVGQVVLN